MPLLALQRTKANATTMIGHSFNLNAKLMIFYLPMLKNKVVLLVVYLKITVNKQSMLGARNNFQVLFLKKPPNLNLAP